MQRKEKNKAATSDEEEWEYVLDGAAAEGNSSKNETMSTKDTEWGMLEDNEEDDGSKGVRLEAIEEMELQLRRQENVVKLLRKFVEDPNAEGMGKSLNELGVKYYDIIQLLVTETNESTIYQEIVTNVLRKLEGGS